MGVLGGRTALVTGAASGIGAACAASLAGEGATVFATDIDDAAGAALVRTIVDRGHDAIYIHQDVTDEDGWRDLVAQIKRDAGRLDILVSNAGIGIGASSIVDMSLADWRRQTAVNLDAVFLSVKHCLPLMRESGGGSIILMSSVAGLRGSSFLAGYSATKGAVRLFAKSIAMECAQAGDGIRVNSVHPGFIDTPVWGKITNQGRSGGDTVITAGDAARSAVPMGRAGRPDEVAAGVLFLASDASSYMTGSELVMDGGIMTGGGVKAPV
ncbi:MAG: Dehydrogenase [Sphingomonadales bacterium]|nr:Dehydrogenase [Sphingomonadales bacterium]